MARTRDLKPGFFKNESLAECTPWARLLFAGLWCIADREGRLEDRPKRIKAEVLPYDSVEPEPLLVELAARQFIVRYEVDGRRLIQVAKFGKHQSPHPREAASILPSPLSEQDLGAAEATPRHGRAPQDLQDPPPPQDPPSSPSATVARQHLGVAEPVASDDVGMARVRRELAEHFGRSRPLGLGRDESRVAEEFDRWIRHVGVEGTVAECKRLSKENGVRPANLAWYVKWFETASDEDLEGARRRAGGVA